VALDPMESLVGRIDLVLGHMFGKFRVSCRYSISIDRFDGGMYLEVQKSSLVTGAAVLELGDPGYVRFV
jgi:hypothetical protein